MRKSQERNTFENSELGIACKERDNYTCQRCGAVTYDKSRAYTAHHIWYLEEGGPNVLENLVTLCRSCHTTVHAHKVSPLEYLPDNLLKNFLKIQGAYEFCVGLV